ncbi:MULTISPECIES: peptidase domain-containing ABC transporter [Leeuwenhoekiella]|jgi:ABC-type bacteriocin/lantibiotic exporter with double-glycine peptidase domain|uniref:HlyB/MsbA family ABC transporter n=1 Tax=Leeuwenhoekiella blandensis (strain CECT 7118 / CCUG 51940 / KCTC 22103 / MED217) TaxID=398720 RepID=A3XJB9_LEEBM|nr:MULTISPECIES: ABC transporter ATP-binding protein [Leeuwenhoekiella]EAQ50353.1 HlyB/MsbA family ABC transporter [Leeuwenhoekiella blandensis MED217]MAO42804.1 ABC transporter ATP-binding protein/permease [Leeuwenhoekiella sp.]HBT09715.1 ABC transporter ATP-binding protein/permease [Leeuwenhoekiella sp.]HCW64952.1 ABC transporter ATP-binding protein/permease [Leeuwenhoekiella sp.]|tara:strand:- start:8019 stop:9686 length:1668 start_codon:yes stop_codon:yes gene_type:complete
MDSKTLTPWQRFVRLLKLEKQDFLQILYYAIFAGIVSLSLPLGIQAIVNLIQGAQITTSWIILVILVTLGVAFVGALQLMQIRILENIQQKIFTRASFEFTYRFPKIKMSELKDYYPPELANRFFDILTIQKSLYKLVLDFPAALVQIIFGLILLSFYHPFFIFYGILLILLIYLVFKFTGNTGLQTSLNESKYKYKIAHWIQEIARALVSFKLSGRSSLALDKNDALVSDYVDSRESHFRILRIQFIQMIAFKVLVTAGLLLIGGILVLNQQMNIGQFVAAEIIIVLIIGSVEKLILGLENFYDLLTALEKVGQVVDKKLEDQELSKPFEAEDNLHLELRNVSYEDHADEVTILDKVSLKINPGDHVLVNGPNGSGKSTLLKIIAGILEPTSGEFFINNKSVKGIQLNHYRALLGQSFPEETPFEGTILDNITFGDKTVPQKNIDWAVEKMGLADFVKDQPNGLNTLIKPEGQRLSKTIADKIVMARSIVRKPKLLILKEPLTKFSTEEKERIVNFLFDKSNPWAIIVASKDKAWQNCCERTLWLDSGKLSTSN